MLIKPQSSRWPPSSLPVRDHADLELHFLLEDRVVPLSGMSAARIDSGKERRADWEQVLSSLTVSTPHKTPQ